MLKSITSLAGAAIILAIFATTSVQARQITADTPKVEQLKRPKLAKVQCVPAQSTQAPFLWLVLGVGF